MSQFVEHISDGEQGRSRRGGRGSASAPSAGLRFTPPPKLYRMGEVVEHTGFSRQTIHNYTTMGLLRERRWTPGGHRLYDESVFERLARIAELKDQRKSMKDIREYFAAKDRREG